MATKAATQLETTVGALLYDTRTSLSVDRHDVSLKTKIPERYVRGLENGAYEDIPDDVYTKIYLKAYCAYLGLDAGSILARYREERSVAESINVNGRRKHPTTSIPATQLMIAPKIIRGVIFGLLVLGLAAYFATQVKKIVTPPEVTLASPKDGLMTIERSVAVEGWTEHEVTLRINGKQVPTDDNGNFRDIIDLQDGVNEITLVAAKKYSKPMTVTRRIIVEQAENPTAQAPLEGGGP